MVDLLFVGKSVSILYILHRYQSFFSTGAEKSFFVIHAAIKTNIDAILFPTVVNAHRRPIQCGACDINGDIINPYIVTGTQKYTYICGMK
jgi:hypothetical protein|tara:strand:+ start:2037 stop:2306 length:270 start_codon:yes stop_codon:yes gene_type:complete